jgi:hypothetical protein
MFKSNTQGLKVFATGFVLTLALPLFALAESVQIFAEGSSGGSITGSGSVNFGDYNISKIVIEVDASAYAGSQGGNGRGYAGYAEAVIGTTKDVQDIPNGSDPMNVRAFNSMTVTKKATGNWMNGATDMGGSLAISAQANASGEDSVGNADVSGWVYWINAVGGGINVTANNASATWTITGPETITGSGSSASYSNKPAGTYTITWGNVTGQIAPASSSLTLNSGGTINFPQGLYTPVPTVNVDFLE